jgi:hydrogenase maturation protease
MTAQRSRSTLILGLGNDVLMDDGVGLRAARRVAELVGDRADFVEACMASIDLLPIISGYERVIIVDAFRSPDFPPGTSVRAAPEDLPRGFGYRSLHTMPFQEMLDLGETLELEMPREVVIHGLAVAEASTFGETFTPEVGRSWLHWAASIAVREFGVEMEG